VLRDTVVHLLRDNFTEAKIRGKKSYLLERQQLQSLTEFKSQTEVIGFLADSPYGPELSKLPDSASPAEVERTIGESLARTVENIETSAKGNVRQFIVEYRRRYDARDLARLLVFKLQGRPWEEYVATRSPLGTLSDKQLRKLYNIENPRDLIEDMGDQTLQDRLEDMQLENPSPDKAALIRDIIVGWGDERLYAYARNQLTGRDRASCIPIIGSAIDLGNIDIILRGKLLGLADIRSHLVHVSWKLDLKTLESLLSSEDIQQALDMIGAHRYYRRILVGSRQKYEETKSLAFVEVIAREHFARLGHEIFLGIPYTIGVVLAFLVLKDNEARNLSAIISGIDAGLSPEQVRPLLAT